jgi:hypothetical protein
MPSIQREDVLHRLKSSQPFEPQIINAMANTPPNPSPLLNLPAELRLMILNYVVDWNTVQHRLINLKEDSLKRHDFISKLTPELIVECHLDSQNALLRVCRQLAVESSSILLQKQLEIPTFLFLSLHNLSISQPLSYLLKSIRQKLSIISLLFKHQSLTLNICVRITTWSSNFAKGEDLYALVAYLRVWAARFKKMVTVKVRTVNERVIETMVREGLSEAAVLQQQSEDIAFVEREFLWGLKGKALVLATHLR